MAHHDLHQVPVVVAGAGPAGLAAAAELALHGIECLVIEPRRLVSHDRPRAKTTSIRTMEHLRRWGVADALRQAAYLAPEWSQRVTFCETLAGRRITDIDDVFGLTDQRDDRFAESGQQVPQPIVEEVLRSHLAGLAGVDLRLGSLVLAAETDADGAVVLIDDPDHPEPVRVRCHYLLACDGATSALRRSLGARLVGSSESKSNFNVVFRAPDLDTDLGPAVQYWVMDAPVPGLIGRLDLDGLWWAIFPGIDAADGISRAAALVHGLIGRDAEMEVLSTDSWTARMLIADTFGEHPIYLVGESAHLNPPYGGHGFNTCVGDAVNLAWKIAAVENGWGGPALLASYQHERRAVVEQTVDSATRNLAALPAELSHDPAAIRATKDAEFHSLGLVLGYSYAGSPVIQDGAEIPARDEVNYRPETAPGSLLPHWWLTDGASLYDRLGTGIALVGPIEAKRDQVAGLCERATAAGIPLTVVPAPAGYPWADEFLLVRPDQHIAWRTDDPTGIDLDLISGRSPVGTCRMPVPQSGEAMPRIRS